VWTKLIAALLKKIFINGEMVFPSQVRLSTVHRTAEKGIFTVIAFEK
jgi:hypothetical protein